MREGLLQRLVELFAEARRDSLRVTFVWFSLSFSLSIPPGASGNSVRGGVSVVVEEGVEYI